MTAIALIITKDFVKDRIAIADTVLQGLLNNSLRLIQTEVQDAAVLVDKVKQFVFSGFTALGDHAKRIKAVQNRQQAASVPTGSSVNGMAAVSKLVEKRLDKMEVTVAKIRSQSDQEAIKF